MSDKAQQPYSISKVIREVIKTGVPTSRVEADFHFEALRTSERSGLAEALGGERAKGICVPLRGGSTPAQRQLTVAGSGWTGLRPIEDLGVLRWSAVAQAGAQFLGPLSDRVNIWHTDELPENEWVPEVGQVAAPSNPTLRATAMAPLRIATEVRYSQQLGIQSSILLDTYLEREIGRGLSSALDEACLYGSGAANFQPLGLLNVVGVNAITFPAAAIGSSWEGLNDMRLACLDHDVYPDSYAIISSPTNEDRLLRDVPFDGIGPTVWHSLPDPKFFSREVNDNRFFTGCCSYMCIGLWGGTADQPGYDLVIDPYTRSQQGQIVCTASLWCNVVVRWPEVFAFSQADPILFEAKSPSKKKAA
jgi:hypothetical protein